MSDENVNNENENASETNENVSQPEVKLTELVKKNPAYQQELNVLMADNRRKLTQQNQDLVKELEGIKRNSMLTQEERDNLQARITQLEEQYMTKEELAKREVTKQQKDYEQKLQEVSQKQELWQKLYTNETIDRALQDSAVNNKAERPWQIVDMLRAKTQLVEDLDEAGNPTGRYVPIIKFNDITEDGKDVVLDLSPDAALKRMRELPEKYGNLFQGTKTSGLGESNNGYGTGTRQPALTEVMSDPAKYAEWRKKNPDLDISKLTR